MTDEIKNDIAIKIFESKIENFPVKDDLSKIKPVNFDELINSVPTPIEYILHPWLPSKGLAFVYASTGVGKTLFTMNAAYAIAGGGDFLKYRAPKPRRVLYIDGEMSFPQIHFRFINIVKQQGPLFFKDNWFLLTPDKAYPARLPKICQPEGQAFYNQFIDQNNIEVLVIDNLSVLTMIDENNSEQWKVIQDWLIYLRTKGLAVIVVHHSGKDKQGYRGTSRMLDCIDTAISLQDITDDKLEDNFNVKKFKIEYQKNRGFSGADAMSFEASVSFEGWNYQTLEKTNLELIVERLNIGMTHREIATELKVSRPYISKLASKAKAQGLIKEGK